MTKEKLWRIFVKANPSFGREGNVTMSANGLKKMFDTTWDQSAKETEQKTIESFKMPKRLKEELFSNIFHGMN
jgi:hypothetical protein